MLTRRVSLIALLTFTSTVFAPFTLNVAVPFSSFSALAQTQNLLRERAERLLQQGNEQVQASQFRAAKDSYQQALSAYREISDRPGESAALQGLGIASYSLGNYAEAIKFYQQSLTVIRTIGDRQGEGAVIGNLGIAYYSLGDYGKAAEYLQQHLAIMRTIGNRQGERQALGDLGNVYYALGDYPKAIEYQQQSLTIARQISDRAGEARTLNNLGLIYAGLSQYPEALSSYQQAAALFKALGDPASEARTFNNIGLIFTGLGQYSKALDFYEQSTALFRASGDRAGEGTTLNNIGLVYDSLNQHLKALDFYQQALNVRREIGDLAGEGTTLNNIGLVYDSLDQHSKALEFLNQSLAIFVKLGKRAGEGSTLHSLGLVYEHLGEYPQALNFYQRSLSTAREIGDLIVQRMTLSGIGSLLEKQNQPELAIVFYKQSVNISEAIRQNLRVLPFEQQQSFTQTVADTYRRLADLLLKQDRVLEAQRVLDLLKVQELDDYLRNVRGNNQTELGIEYLPNEQQFLAQYDAKLTKAIQLGRELEQLQKIPPNERTPVQEQRRREIEAAQREITREYLDFIRTPETVAMSLALNRTTNRENLNLEVLPRLQDDLKQLKQDAVLLYPLILDDRIELVLVTPYTPPIRRPVPVKREELSRAIAEFRSALTNPTSNARIPAQRLYNWLIQPIDAALQEANAKTIIYAPDGQLRYIPLAALYDGNQWLVEKYRINNITALSLTDFGKPPQALKILAGAFSQGNFSFQVGNRTFSFRGLPFAGKEVENLTAVVPETTKLLNLNFSSSETVARMSDYSILHLATHAAFVTGQPEDSFIMFGNGDRATFRDVETWPLTNTDLVVLSACETGVGGFLGNGEEILGFGYLMQKRGARAAIASLWQVDDGGTQALMNAFYVALQANHLTKAEALRQAQIALITGDYKALGDQRGLIVVERIRSNLLPEVANRLNHPYYWAPFILIGNGL